MNSNNELLQPVNILQRVSAIIVICGCLVASLHAQVLPPPSEGALREHKVPGEVRINVQGFRFEGNTAFSSTELAHVTEPYARREITTEELEQARRAVTLHYVNHGYVNSGAIIPDQNPTNGIITMRIVEGVLSGIELKDNKWLRDRYITSHLERWAGKPLNLVEMQEGLQLLRQNPNVKQINAELKPGTAPGEGLLDVRVQDQQPFRLGLQVDNERPVSVGAEEISVLASDLNLTGHSDPLDIRYGIANMGDNGFELSGIDNMEASYYLPLNRYDTAIGIHGSRLNTSLTERDFSALGIESLTKSYGIMLRQPVYQTASREAAVSLTFDHRQNNTWLLDEPFTVSPGAINGKMVASVLRFSQEWLQRGQAYVVALRSTFNFGLDVWGATDDNSPLNDDVKKFFPHGLPDATFFAWVGQGQYIQRLFHTQNQFVLRVSGQMTGEPLLALEQMSVGGMQTVRGYLENQLVRDKAIVASAEFRVPFLFDKSGAGIVDVVPFFDFGGGWNINGSNHPETIYSTGLGLIANPCKHFSAAVYWGYRLREIENLAGDDPQNLGIHFRFNINAF